MSDLRWSFENAVSGILGTWRRAKREAHPAFAQRLPATERIAPLHQVLHNKFGDKTTNGDIPSKRGFSVSTLTHFSQFGVHARCHYSVCVYCVRLGISYLTPTVGSYILLAVPICSVCPAMKLAIDVLPPFTGPHTTILRALLLLLMFPLFVRVKRPRRELTTDVIEEQQTDEQRVYKDHAASYL